MCGCWYVLVSPRGLQDLNAALDIRSCATRIHDLFLWCKLVTAFSSPSTASAVCGKECLREEGEPEFWKPTAPGCFYGFYESACNVAT